MNSHRAAHEIPGLKHVLIDGFRHKMEDIDISQRFYFLSHYHSDHYGGLNPSWNKGNIICSTVTASLLVNVHGVSGEWIRSVDMNGTITIPGSAVTFLDANHCPGAVLLLFKLTGNKSVTYLHTGDMRYHPKMKLYDALQDIKIDKIFLDTTYAHPKHKFMTQLESISIITEQAIAFFNENPEGLILLGAYNIGKERVICGLQDSLNMNVYMEDKKLKLMKCLGPDIMSRVEKGSFVTNPRRARVHVCRMGFAGKILASFYVFPDMMRF